MKEQQFFIRGKGDVNRTFDEVSNSFKRKKNSTTNSRLIKNAITIGNLWLYATQIVLRPRFVFSSPSSYRFMFLRSL